MSKVTLAQKSEEMTNVLNGFRFDPHFRGKVREIRAMGYTLFTAILEFIDNSVRRRCGSKHVIIKLHRTIEPPYLLDRISILDDGCGMTMTELCDSFIFNVVKDREDGDIGKFHVGGKYAAIAKSDEFSIISKKKDGDIVGLYADVRQMQERNSFAPTAINQKVDDEWALQKISPLVWQQFKDLIASTGSGTIIHIPTLVANNRTNFEKHVNEFRRGLSTSYTGLYNDCVIVLEDQDKVIDEIHPVDLFYSDRPEVLDEPAYETELISYYAGPGIPARIIERVTTSRKLPNKKLRCGTPTRPQYLEYRAVEKNKKGNHTCVFQVDALPDDKDILDRGRVRIIQVSESEFKKEAKYFPEGSRLAGDRKGFWFNREIRNVGAAKQLNKKLGDRTSMAAERQRCLYTFSDKSDELVGSKFNKQMEDNALPCATLDTALKEIYKQVTRPWINKWTTREEVVEEADEQEDELVFDDEGDKSNDMDEEEKDRNINDILTVFKKIGENNAKEEVRVFEEEVVEETKEENQQIETEVMEEEMEAKPEIQVEKKDETPVLMRGVLNYAPSTNSLVYMKNETDALSIVPPGDGKALVEYLTSIQDKGILDRLVELLSSVFPG